MEICKTSNSFPLGECVPNLLWPVRSCWRFRLALGAVALKCACVLVWCCSSKLAALVRTVIGAAGFLQHPLLWPAAARCGSFCCQQRMLRQKYTGHFSA